MSDATLTDVVVPKWGMTMDSAVLIVWLKQVGDPVSVDDSIAEMETDKATNEVLSQVDGILVEQVVAEGTEVEPGQPIARIRVNVASA